MSKIFNIFLLFIVVVGGFVFSPVTYAESSKLPTGWYQDGNVSGSRLMFRNLELSAFVEFSEVPAENHTIESIANGIAKKTGCLKTEKSGKYYLLTCDDKHIYIRVAVSGKNAEITRVGCHDKQRCSEAMNIVEQLD